MLLIEDRLDRTAMLEADARPLIGKTVLRTEQSHPMPAAWFGGWPLWTAPLKTPTMIGVRRQQEELRVEQGERFIVVYQAQVLGVGGTDEAALQNAESNLPPGDAEITPIVELLHKRQPFLGVRPPSDVQLPARDNS